jgi:hypothetical protein
MVKRIDPEAIAVGGGGQEGEGGGRRGRGGAGGGGGGQEGECEGGFARLLSGAKVVRKAGEGEGEGVFGTSASIRLSLKEEQERLKLLATLGRRLEHFDKIAAKCKSSSASTCADGGAIRAQFEMLGTLHCCLRAGGGTVRLIHKPHTHTHTHTQLM